MVPGMPDNSVEFDFSETGETSGQTFQGKFKYKRLTIKEKLESQRWISKQIGVEKDDENLVAGYMILASIKFGFVDGPDWFKSSNLGEDLLDTNIATAIFSKIKEAEEEHRKKLLAFAETVNTKSSTED